MIIVNTIINLAYIKCSCASLLEPWQNNLNDPEVHSKLKHLRWSVLQK